MRLLDLRILLSFLAASAAGMVLYFKFPLPEMNVFLNLLKARGISRLFAFLKYSYVALLLPHRLFGFSLLTSFLYPFIFNSQRKGSKPYSLPPYPDGYTVLETHHGSEALSVALQYPGPISFC